MLLLQWAMLLDGFMIEAKWLSTNQDPAPEDYLRNGVVTSGGPLVYTHIFFMLGRDVAKDAAKLIDHIPPVISCPAKILRLWDDMGSAKVRALFTFAPHLVLVKCTIQSTFSKIPFQFS